MDKILKRVQDKEANIEARLIQTERGHVFGVFDLDEQVYCPSMRIFETKKGDSLKKATTYFEEQVAYLEAN